MGALGLLICVNLWLISPQAYVLKGTTQVSSVDQEGRNYLASVKAGDLWYFPRKLGQGLSAFFARLTGS